MNLAILSTVLLSISSGVSSEPTPQAILDCYNDCELLSPNDEAINQCVQNCPSSQTGRLRGTKQNYFEYDKPLTCRQACDHINTTTRSRNRCYEEYNCPSTDFKETGESFLARPTEPVNSICRACDSLQPVIDRLYCLEIFNCNSFERCFVNCQNESNVADCVNQRCICLDSLNCDGNENSASFVKSPVNDCDACGLFTTERARNACYDYNNCHDDRDASFQDASECDSCNGFQSVVLRNYCLDHYNCDRDNENDASFVKSSTAANLPPFPFSSLFRIRFDCDVCGFFSTERARNACYDFNNCDKDPDASLQDATFVESAFPGPGPNPPESGHTLFDCFTRCESESDVPNCILRRCFNDEALISSSNHRPTNQVTSICEVCDSFQEESSRQVCLDHYNCRNDHDASLQDASFVESAAPGVPNFSHCFLSCKNDSNIADCIRRRCIRSENSIESSAPLQDTALDAEFQEYVKQARPNKQVEEVEFVSTNSSCLNRGSVCNYHSDCCGGFCNPDAFFPAFYPSRCL